MEFVYFVTERTERCPVTKTTTCTRVKEIETSTCQGKENKFSILRIRNQPFWRPSNEIADYFYHQTVNCLFRVIMTPRDCASSFFRVKQVRLQEHAILQVFFSKTSIYLNEVKTQFLDRPLKQIQWNLY